MTDVFLSTSTEPVTPITLVRSSYRADRILDQNNLGLGTPERRVPIKTL